jgi:nucleotide-binding universal stress UspA family protein
VDPPLGEKETKADRFSKLLVGIDGSETSDYALNLAIHIGVAFSSQVDLIFVNALPGLLPVSMPLYDPLSAGPILNPMPGWQTEELRKGAAAKDEALVEHRKKLVEESGLQCVATVVESEDVASEIIKKARDDKYGLIVIGSRGLSGLQSLILGSVSRKVAKEAKTSVLVAKNKLERLPKILLGYDGSEESREALYAAAELALKFKGQVDPLGVISIPAAAEGAVLPDSFSTWDKEMKDNAREAIELLKERGITKCEGKTVDASDVAKGIVEAASGGSYDLIAVGNRGYGRLKSFFLGSVASGVADQAKTNVLIVR